MSAARILAFAGSAKSNSLNKKVLTIAASGAEDTGAEVSVIDLRDFPMPIFDEDLEASEGLPENARKLQELFAAHDGLLLACPEYNSSITPLLKNVLDWVSRSGPDGSGLQYYKGKTAALISASPGGLGGLRGLVHVRAILGNLGMILLPQQVAVSGAGKLFDAAGAMTDERKAGQLKDIGASLAEMTARLKS